MDVETAREIIATEPPRRLRIDELLRELGARERDPIVPVPGVPPAPGLAPRPPRSPDPGELPPPEPPRDLRPTTITVGALVDKAAEGGFGFLVGVLSLIAIPFVGVSTPFGLAIALLGAQLMLGLARPWLPQRARRRALAMTMLDRVLALLTHRTRWLARLSRRRWEIAIQPRMLGFGITLLALGLALPLPIPGSNLVFLIPLFIYAVGLLERDGLWIAVGHLCTAIDVVLLFVFGASVVAVLERLWHWLT